MVFFQDDESLPATTMKITNHHSHTFRCKHAQGDAVDYVRHAFQGGASVYGISDHSPIPDGRYPEVRMAMEELDSYENAVRKAQSEFPEVKVLLGMECEYFPEFHAFYEDELLGQRGYDYLIGAGHYTPLEGSWQNSFANMDQPKMLNAYSRHLAEIMESGLFAFIAHPDLFGCSNEFWNDDLTSCSHDILSSAQATKTPLEINGYGMRKEPVQTSKGPRAQYPWPPFWELASEYKIEVVCNSDAHRPQDALACLDETRLLADRFDLKIADLSHLGSSPKQAIPLVA